MPGDAPDRPGPPGPSATDSVSTGVFQGDRRALTLGILIAVGAFAVEGMGVVPALPTAVTALSGLPWFGWAFSAFMLAWLVGTIAAGRMADAVGPLPPMALGLSGFGAGLLLAAAAGGMTQFLAGRALQGLGGGAMIAAAYVAIARGYPDGLRARMMALTASVWILPAIVGPVLSGAIVQWTSWRFVFAGVVPFVVLAAVLVLPPLRRFSLRRPPAGAARVISAVQLSLGSGLVLLSPSLQSYGLPAAIACAVAGALLLFPALRALLPTGTLLLAPGLPAGLAMRGVLAFCFYGTEAFVPLGAVELRGATPSQAGLSLTAGALGWIGASWTQDRIEARGDIDGRARRVGIGFVMIAAGIALLAATLLTSLPLLLGFFGWAVGGAGMGCAFGAGGLLCIAAAPAGQEGEVSGQLQVMEALGTAAGTGVGGVLLSLGSQLAHSPREAHALVFSLTLLTALAGAAMAGRSAPVPARERTDAAP